MARVLLALGIVAASAAVMTPADAAPTGPLTVTASKTTGLVDGEVIDIDVAVDLSGPDPVSSPRSIEVYLCRPGETYDSLNKLKGLNGNCVGEVNTGAIGSGDAGARHGPLLFFQDGKATVKWAIGTGVAEWFSPIDPAKKFTLACDESHPCTMVVRTFDNTQPIPQWFQLFSIPLTFSNVDPLAGCAGRTPELRGSQPFRLDQLWSMQTQAACTSGTRVAIASGVAGGEDENLQSYGEGLDDITYTGVGYHDPTVLGTITKRPSVAVPIGVNAVVLAFAGKRVDAGGARLDWSGLQVTTDELGYLVAGSLERMQYDQPSPNWGDIANRNPALDPFPNRGLPQYADGIAFGPMLLSNGDTSSWVLTRYLNGMMGADWSVAATSDPNYGARLGVSFALGPAEPAFTHLSLQNGLPAMRKTLVSLRNPRQDESQSPFPVVTDLVTANNLGLAPALLSTGRSDGEFTAATPEAMATAVSQMPVDPSGMRFAPDRASAGGGYPLTFVEYALVPCQPPSDATAADLRSWLTYLTGPGQAQLPAGMVALTPQLAAEAKAAIAKVGHPSDLAGCETETGPGGSAGGGGSGSLEGSGSGSGSGSNRIGAGSGGGTGAYAISGAGGASADDAAAASTSSSPEPPIGVVAPEYAGNRAAGALFAVLALALVGGLSTFAALHSAGRAPWQQSDTADATPEPTLLRPDDGLDVIELR